MISSILLGALLASHASAACTRAQLQDATALYIKAQTGGTPSLLPLSSNLSYTENDAPTPLSKGLLNTPIKIDLARSLHDTTTCSTFTEISAATNAHPYVIATRLILSTSQITAIDSVIADAGDWLFNATAHLAYASKEQWGEIPESKRDTRAVLQRAGDLYLDSWGDGRVKAPYGTPCARLEGGAYTGDKKPESNSCFMPEFPQPFRITRRGYVIDETIGGVGILNEFPFIDKAKPQGTSSTNLFRVEGGLIRYIHENTICTQRNCGR